MVYRNLGVFFSGFFESSGFHLESISRREFGIIPYSSLATLIMLQPSGCSCWINRKESPRFRQDYKPEVLRVVTVFSLIPSDTSLHSALHPEGGGCIFWFHGCPGEESIMVQKHPLSIPRGKLPILAHTFRAGPWGWPWPLSCVQKWCMFPPSRTFKPSLWLCFPFPSALRQQWFWWGCFCQSGAWGESDVGQSCSGLAVDMWERGRAWSWQRSPVIHHDPASSNWIVFIMYQ